MNTKDRRRPWEERRETGQIELRLTKIVTSRGAMATTDRLTNAIAVSLGPARKDRLFMGRTSTDAN